MEEASAERALALYRTMARIRAFEEAAEQASLGGVAAFGAINRGPFLEGLKEDESRVTPQAIAAAGIELARHPRR